MDWIKKNYDKLLLGVFGLFAVGVGGLLASNSLGSDEATGTNKVTEKSVLGPDKIEETKKALEELTAKRTAVWTFLPISEHRTAHLFTASPAVQKAGADTIVQLLDAETPPLREGIPNWWLYENNLDLTRDDVATQDPDGDKYSNAEEFEGKSSPSDPDSRPPFFTKLHLIEIIEDKYEIRNRGIEGNDISLSRPQPLPMVNGAPGAPLSSLQFHVGDTIFKDDNRFKITGVEDRNDKDGKPVKNVILSDTKNGNKELAIPVKETLNLPTYQAKIKSMISEKEGTYKEADEFSPPDFPSIKVTIEKIIPADPANPESPGIVEISFTEPGKPKAKAQLKLTK